MTTIKTKRLGNYRYEVIKNRICIGLVSVCRCGSMSQWYQVQLPNGDILKEFSSVKKAAQAACNANA